MLRGGAGLAFGLELRPKAESSSEGGLHIIADIGPLADEGERLGRSQLDLGVGGSARALRALNRSYLEVLDDCMI